MNNKDKEAFEEWLESMRFSGDHPEGYERRAWQDACEYARNELSDDLEHYIKESSVWMKAAQKHFKNIKELQDENKKLQENILLLQEKTLVLGEFEDENKKLRDALNILRQNLKWDHGNSQIIREALEEVGEE